MNNVNQLPPFAPVDLRVWIEGNSDQRDVVGAIRLIQWIEGPEVEIYLDMIVAACAPTSKRQVQRGLASCKAHGWVLSNRKKKRNGRGLEAPTYTLAIKPLAFKDARTVLDQRANLAPRSEGPTRQISLTYAPNSTDQGATQARSLIQEKDLRERLKERKTLPASAGEVRFKKPVPEIRTYFEAQYQARHGEPVTPVVFDWVPKIEAHLVKVHGLQKMKARIDHYLDDPNRDTHPYDTFLRRPDDWAKPRVRKGFVKTDDYAPKPRRSAADDMARSLGIEVDDDGR